MKATIRATRISKKAVAARKPPNRNGARTQANAAATGRKTYPAVTASATAQGFRLSKSYNNLILESTESLYAGNSVAGNDSKLVVHAFGGAY